jgi:signal transduction histidine kinase
LSEFAKNESKNHPENIPNILQKINESSRKLQDNLQDIVWTTQNSEHKLESLTSRMRLFAGEILEAKDIDYQIDINKEIGNINLNSTTQYDIFMIYKEAINNIVKYAKAQKVRIEFIIFENEIRLKIIDNGHGFDLNSEKTGNGLKNMKSRAENIGGILHLKSEIGKGSMVDLILPVPN